MPPIFRPIALTYSAEGPIQLGTAMPTKQTLGENQRLCDVLAELIVHSPWAAASLHQTKCALDQRVQLHKSKMRMVPNDDISTSKEPSGFRHERRTISHLAHQWLPQQSTHVSVERVWGRLGWPRSLAVGNRSRCRRGGLD